VRGGVEGEPQCARGEVPLPGGVLAKSSPFKVGYCKKTGSESGKKVRPPRVGVKEGRFLYL